MTRAPVLFRVDAGPKPGYEHLQRCLVFAAALQRRRRPAYFLSRLEPATLAGPMKRGGNEWIPVETTAGTADDLDETLKEVRRLQPHAVVVDAPAACEAYLKELRSTGVAVVSIDSLGAIRFPSQLVVNPLLGPTRSSYDFHRGTQLLVGQRYAIIRPEVRRVRPLRAQEPQPPFRVLVALGDDDHHNQSGEIAKHLLNCPKVGRVDVLVRSYHPDVEALRAMAETCPDRLEIVTEPSDVPLRISRCHMAVTAGNSWSLEMACVGVPQLVVVQSEVHWPTAHALEESGAAMCLGWHANLNAGSLRQAVTNLLGDPLERLSMARSGRKLIDGRGPDRLVTALEIVLHPMQRAALLEAA
jgi:spore coat polysaccharide biosynthesis predicted glycosyltransferase SpsG